MTEADLQGLDDRSLTAPQIRLVEFIIDQLTARGVMSADALFAGKETVIEGIFDTLADIHAGLGVEIGRAHV